MFVQIPATTTRILLNHFKWDKEKLMERFYDGDQEKLFKDAHVINPFNKPISTPKPKVKIFFSFFFNFEVFFVHFYLWDKNALTTHHSPSISDIEDLIILIFLSFIFFFNLFSTLIFSYFLSHLFVYFSLVLFCLCKVCHLPFFKDTKTWC